ncbi:MAG TPA: ubiquinol-cytochrome c reductase iron-sulfur subunit [Candidatus Limnocylindrales bacterium]|nr:ubiquinol-cytochrome c reductase iron-sulfur subunit [Candidatus Limnocylindrales bacterium]
MPEHVDPKTAEKHGAPVTPPSLANSNSPNPPEEVNRTRRRLIWTCIGGYLGVNLLMFLRYFFPRALFEPPTVFAAGYVSDYGLGVDQRFLQSERCWVVREPGRLFVIFAQCTHLGCTPDWIQSQNIFHCPCHGSEYDSEGVNFAGPAPRPMDRCHIILDPSNQLVVDTSQRYIMDPAAGTNQFNDPGAFINT